MRLSDCLISDLALERKVHIATVAKISVTAPKPLARPKKIEKFMLRSSRTLYANMYIVTTQPIPPINVRKEKQVTVPMTAHASGPT